VRHALIKTHIHRGLNGTGNSSRTGIKGIDALSGLAGVSNDGQVFRAAIELGRLQARIFSVAKCNVVRTFQPHSIHFKPIHGIALNREIGSKASRDVCSSIQYHAFIVDVLYPFVGQAVLQEASLICLL